MATMNKGVQSTGSIPGPIPSSISAAIESNVALQAELRRRLLKIKCKKVQNRRDAARVAASISRCWNDNDDDGNGSLGNNDPLDGRNTSTSEPSPKRSRVDIAQGRTSGTSEGSEKTPPFNADGEETLTETPRDSRTSEDKVKNSEEGEKTASIGVDGKRASSNDNDSDPMVTSKVDPKSLKYEKSKWQLCNRRTKGFFVDPNGSTPETLWSNVRGEHEIETERQSTRAIFERKDDKISSSDEPQKTWEAVKRKNWPSFPFNEAALRIDKTFPISTDECRVACFTFADSKIAKTKFTKQECIFITSMIGRMGGHAQQSTIDWHEVAMQHYAKFNTQTPWLCFSHYRSSLQTPSTRCPTWTPEEDELLLKYLAMQGPQYYLHGDSLEQTTRNLFPSRSCAQLAVRAQATLINPNYANDAWDPDEKRKLALLMRVYSKEKNPTKEAARMFHFPHRAPKSVFEKWIKTLDPTLSYRPITEEEDDE